MAQYAWIDADYEKREIVKVLKINAKNTCKIKLPTGEKKEVSKLRLTFIN